MLAELARCADGMGLPPAVRLCLTSVSERPRVRECVPDGLSRCSDAVPFFLPFFFLHKLHKLHQQVVMIKTSKVEEERKAHTVISRHLDAVHPRFTRERNPEGSSGWRPRTASRRHPDSTARCSRPDGPCPLNPGLRPHLLGGYTKGKCERGPGMAGESCRTHS